MSVSLIGADGTNIATVSNGVPASLPSVTTRLGGITAAPNSVGAIAMYAENDAGTITGAKNLASPIVSADRRMLVGVDTPLFDYTFGAAASNTGVWKFMQAATAMAATESGGFLTLNSGSVLTSAAGCAYSTWTQFSLRGVAALHVSFTLNPSLTITANQVIEAGLFLPWASGGAQAAPPDGVFFRITNAGVIGVATFAGTETPTTTYAVVTAATSEEFAITVSERQVQFWRNGVLLQTLSTPAAQGQPFQSQCLPFTMQTRNTALVSGSIGLARFSDCHIEQQESNTVKPYPHQMSKMGLMGSQAQPGATMGSTANTSAAGNTTTLGVAAALTNAALGTGNLTGLGGFVHYLPTLTAGPVTGVKGVLCGYQVPVGTTAVPGRSLVITGVDISQSVGVVLVGGPCIMALSLFYGGSTITLATASDTASFTTNTVKTPRQRPLGVQSCIATAVAGTTLTGPTNWKFDSPITVNPGEFVGIAVTNLGTVTSSGEIEAVIGFDAYWE